MSPLRTFETEYSLTGTDQSFRRLTPRCMRCNSRMHAFGCIADSQEIDGTGELESAKWECRGLRRLREPLIIRPARHEDPATRAVRIAPKRLDRERGFRAGLPDSADARDPILRDYWSSGGALRSAD